MTKSIVRQIFVINANRIETNIKKQGADILSECTDFAVLADGKGTDETRDSVLADGTFAWLYDKVSEKTGKKIMSDTNRQIAKAMLKIYKYSNAFVKWYTNEEKTGVTSLRGIESAIAPKTTNATGNKNKGKNNKGKNQPKQNSDNPSQKQKRTKAETYKNILQIWKAAGYGDSIAFADYVATEEAGKIADVEDARKAA